MCSESADIYSLLSSNVDLNESEQRKRALYSAFESADPRFDGQVFVGVSSTGIYCRTVCKARLPKYENCTFYTTAAEAELAGFRPCMTCRPELAPGMANVDAQLSLAKRAAFYLREHCTDNESISVVAGKLGYSDRHLRRAFADELHVTPQQYRQTARLLLAKQLLTETTAPLSMVAQASGFKSVRTFNQAFQSNYHLTPSDLRKRHGSDNGNYGCFTMSLGYLKPYRFDLLLEFFRGRALVGVEKVGESSYARTVRLDDGNGNDVLGWFKVEDDPERSALRVTMSESLFPVVMQVLSRVKRQFDLDCNPMVTQTGISSLDNAMSGAVVEGVRLPGCFDPFETACRAVLGQQISVVAANKLAARIVHRFGQKVETGIDGLSHVFPTSAEMLSIDDIEEAFGSLGVIKTRSRVIAEIARLVEEDEIDFANGNADEILQRLLSVKGIGPWSANYMLMRCMSYPDAFLETDAGVKHAMPDLTPKERLALAEQWRPWRSYATICLWNSLKKNRGNHDNLFR